MKKTGGRKSRDTLPLTKIENILTRWSVAQAGLNDEKTGSRKSRWSVPLRK